MVIGFFVYQRYGGAQDAAKLEDTILFEQMEASRDYSVLLPVGSDMMARPLAQLGALFARANNGKLFALHVIDVPLQMGMGDGRAFLQQARPVLEDVIRVGNDIDVPVHSMLRLGRDIGSSIISVAREQESELMVLGWPSQIAHRHEAFGTLIDLMAKNPPCNLAVVRFRQSSTPKRILVPVAGGPNTRMAIELAITEADSIEEIGHLRPEVIALNLVLLGDKEGDHEVDEQELEKRRQALIERFSLEGLPWRYG